MGRCVDVDGNRRRYEALHFIFGRRRDTGWATDFAFDIRYRVAGRPQIKTDAHKPYMAAIELALVRYGASDEPKTRYSPAKCIGCEMKTVIGEPDYLHVKHQLRSASESDDAHFNGSGILVATS